MRGKVRYVLTSSNTSHGFRTFLPELLQGVAKVFVLKGAPGTGKSTFIRLLGESFSDQGYEVEFWVSADDPVSPEGVFIPQLKAAVVNGSLSSPIDPSYPGVTRDIIYLGDYWDKNILQDYSQEIINLYEEHEQHRPGYSGFEKSRRGQGQYQEKDSCLFKSGKIAGSWWGSWPGRSWTPGQRKTTILPVCHCRRNDKLYR